VSATLTVLRAWRATIRLRDHIVKRGDEGIFHSHVFGVSRNNTAPTMTKRSGQNETKT
jgi:hypothetical protein